MAEADRIATPGVDQVLVDLYKGHALYRTGDIDGATRAYESGMERVLGWTVEIAPTYAADLLVGLANCARESGALSDAIGLYDLASEMYREANNISALIPVEFGRSEALRRAGRIEQAKRHLRVAIEAALDMGGAALSR